MDVTAPVEGWPRFEGPEDRALSITTEPLADDAAVWAALVGLTGARGWICRPHEVVEWPGAEAGGPVVSAELATSDGTSLHIRQEGSGWRAWRYTEGAGKPCIAFHESFAGTVQGDPKRRLDYVVYWALEEEDGIHVYRPFASRFAGWGQE